MNYASLSDLAARCEPDLLFQAVSRGLPDLTEAAMRDRLNGADMSGYTPAADKAADLWTVALTDAADTIDGYLAGRYQLPLSTAPAVLKRYACDIALYDRHGSRFSGDDDPVKIRRDNAVKWLEQVAQGKIDLVLTPPDTAGGENEVEFESSAAVFSRGGW